MNKFTIRKLLAIVFAVVLVLALALTALAAWPSFQNDNSNDGVITPGPAPTAPATTARTLQLRQNGTPFVGIDTESVIVKDIAITLYNGGSVSSGTIADGGARLNATEYMNNPLSSRWNIQLDPKADDVQQLSTPYVNPNDGTAYAATTYYENLLVSSGVTGWLDSTGAQIPSPYTISTSASPVTITYNGLNLPADYWQPQLVTDINASSGTISGTLTLKNTRTGATYTFGSNTYYPGYGPWTLYNNSGTMIPAGNYQVTFTVTTDTNLTVSSLKFIASQWNLYKLTNTTDTQPTVTYVTGGYGQSNTPIGYDGTGNIYWGIYEGDRSYYQYNISTGAVAKFTPANGGDDFYGAGAAYIAHDNTVIFGSDSGTIYKQSVSSFTAQGQTLDLSTIQPDAGQVRSTLAYDGQKILYFTSKGTGANGYLWGIDFTLGVGLPQLQLTGNSTSTPAISDSGYIYVGYNSGFSAGGVVAVLASAFSGTPITIYTGDPVQSSPIVWSDTANDIDYVYFTTNASNSPNHNGYCASYVPGASGGNIVWNPNNPPGVPGSYALQGFAHTSEVGPVVIYGDDSNTLYVFQ